MSGKDLRHVDRAQITDFFFTVKPVSNGDMSPNYRKKRQDVANFLIERLGRHCASYGEVNGKRHLFTRKETKADKRKTIIQFGELHYSPQCGVTSNLLKEKISMKRACHIMQIGVWP